MGAMTTTAGSLRTKEAWLQELESIANDDSRDDRARLAALKEIGQILGFSKQHNFERMATEERMTLVRTIIAPVLESQFSVRVDFGDADNPGG